MAAQQKGPADGHLATALTARGWPTRPLVGQPLAIDLLDTRWLVGDQAFDVLDHADLVRAWLDDQQLDDDDAALNAVRQHLRTTRDALVAAVADPSDQVAINGILDRGRLRLQVDGTGVTRVADVRDPAWRAAWAVARDYVELVERAPGRARTCANPDCPLHFLDTSRTGDRRWCSMAVCGNRSKARRHRTREQLS